MPDSYLGVESVAMSGSLGLHHRFGPLGLRLPILKQGTPVPCAGAQYDCYRHYFTFGRASACLHACWPLVPIAAAACGRFSFSLSQEEALAQPAEGFLGCGPAVQGPYCLLWWLYFKCEREEGKCSFKQRMQKPFLLILGPTAKISLKQKGGSLQGGGAPMTFGSHQYIPLLLWKEYSGGQGWCWPGREGQSSQGGCK